MPSNNDRPHYLTRPSSGTMPDRFLVVHCEPVDDGEFAGPAYRNMLLGEWHAAKFALEDGPLELVDCEAGHTSDGLWGKVAAMARPAKINWLFGYGLAFQLAMTGFWGLVEEDVWQLSDFDFADNEDIEKLILGASIKGGTQYVMAVVKDTFSAKSKFRGFLVLEDAPTIVMARHCKTGAVVRMVDIRNYGMRTLPESKNSAHKAAYIADIVAGIITTCKKLDLGGLQSTAPSQALHGWKLSYMKSPMLVHKNPAATALERGALYAGRNECYRLGKVYGPVYHLDFNSFYGAIATDEQSPTKLAWSGVCTPYQLDVMVRDGLCCFADVILDTNIPDYPMRQDNRTIFPVGVFRTYLAGAELKHALEHDRVMLVEYASAHETDSVFRDWSVRLYNHRLKCQDSGDNVGADVCKRLMVSLFGKFAQWNWQWCDAPDVEPSCPFESWYGVRPTEQYPATVNGRLPTEPWELELTGRQSACKWRSIGWRVQFEGGVGEGINSMPAVTASLYASARVRLAEAMRVAGHDNVFYCDCDSIWTNLAGYKALERYGLVGDEALGALKLKEQLPWVRFLGLKHYETPCRRVHAGVPDHATETAPWQFEFQSAEPMANSLRHGTAPTARVIRHKYNLTAPYRHGHVALNGKVSPYTLRWEK